MKNIFISLIFTSSALASVCVPRHYGSSSVVCVCNATYCDTLEEIYRIPRGYYVHYSTTRGGLRFHAEYGKFFDNTPKHKLVFEIDRSRIFQSIYGWGGAFTDSTGINIQMLPKLAQINLLKSYFSNSGLQYSLCRVPMAGTDFSIRRYTYNDIPDNGTLQNFRLHFEDFNYKIPIIKQALFYSRNSLKLIASPWTAPPWMKTNNFYSGIGILFRKYYQAWANYYIKFLEAYETNGIIFWGITTGNEPFDGLTPLELPSMGWFPRNMAKWLSTHLGPTIRNSRYSAIKIIVHDDQRVFLPFLQEIFNNEAALNYADGVAVHWYSDRFTPPYFLNFAQTPKKYLFLLGTEASTGLLSPTPVLLGSWERAEQYIINIFEDLKYGASGWIDWNMALDEKGGPVYTYFPVDSTIIVNHTNGEFYKQPMFYALGHFSKFLVPGSVRVHSKLLHSRTDKIEVLSFYRPDDSMAIIIFNRDNEDKDITLSDPSRGIINVHIAKKSINSVTYW